MRSRLKEKKQHREKNLVIIVAIAVITVLLVIIIALLKRTPQEEPKRNVIAAQNTVNTIVEDMVREEYVAPGYYSSSMSTTWHFETGDSISADAYVANLAENTNDIYFDVFLADNEDEAIYQSPVLPRGSEIKNIGLDTVLSAGSYDCVMVYHLVDEEQNTISTLRVAFQIIVEG